MRSLKYGKRRTRRKPRRCGSCPKKKTAARGERGRPSTGCLIRRGERSGNELVDTLGVQRGAGLERLDGLTGELDEALGQARASRRRSGRTTRGRIPIWSWKNSVGDLASARVLTASAACSTPSRPRLDDVLADRASTLDGDRPASTSASTFALPTSASSSIAFCDGGRLAGRAHRLRRTGPGTARRCREAVKPANQSLVFLVTSCSPFLGGGGLAEPAAALFLRRGFARRAVVDCSSGWRLCLTLRGLRRGRARLLGRLSGGGSRLLGGLAGSLDRLRCGVRGRVDCRLELRLPSLKISFCCGAT